MYQQQNQSGFALLITIIVVGVILSIGVSVLDLSIKQLRLSDNAKESEIAFHAANAGAECARYWRRAARDDFVIGNIVSPVCFGTAPTPVLPNTLTTVPVVGDGEAFQYEFAFSWGSDSRCSQINMIVASSSAASVGLQIQNMNNYIEGYPSGVDFSCDPGSQCTVVSVKGQNRPCSAVSGVGTVQREVLLQY